MRLATLALVTCAVTGCGEWPCVVDCVVVDRFAFAVVYGEVVAAPDAAPAGDVNVLAGLHPDGCDFEAPVVPDFETTTDPTGHYRLEMSDLGSGFTACVMLVLEPASSSGLIGDIVSVDSVRFEEKVTDSVRVDVVLERS